MTPRTHPTTPLAGALLAIVVLIGGCTVSTSSRRDENRTDLYRAVLAEDRLSLDLSDGLTRAEAGVAPGDATVSFTHDGGQPLIDTTLVLSPEVTLQREVSLVAISGDSVTDREAAPTSVELVRSFDGVEAGRAELQRAATDLGIPSEEVDEWAEGATEAVGSDDAVSFQPRVFRAPAVGTVGVEVEAALFVDKDEVGVRYILTLGR